MHHPEKPAVKLTLSGDEYELIFDFEAIAEAEEITDRAILSGLYTSEAVRPKISFLRALFFACARSLPPAPALTYEQAKALVTQRTFAPVWMAVMQAWKLSQPDTEAPATANPTQGQS